MSGKKHATTFFGLHLPFGHQLFAINEHRRSGGAFDSAIAVVASTSDTVAGREGGKTAGGHKEIHHRIVEHGRSKRARQFVLMMMVMMARRAAATQIVATMSTMTSTAAGGAIRWRVAIGICEKSVNLQLLKITIIYTI